jgi:predicted nucleic acid-binding protein
VTTPTQGGAPTRGLLDTSVLIDLERVQPGTLPDEQAVSALTLAELAAGPHATEDPQERARRQERLQRVEAAVDALPFDDRAARAYGRIYAATRARHRKPRGARAVDLLIAATALANDLPLYTRNPTDFAHLTDAGLAVHDVALTGGRGAAALTPPPA